MSIKAIFNHLDNKTKILLVFAVFMCALGVGVLLVSEEYLNELLDVFSLMMLCSCVYLLWDQREQNQAIMNYLKSPPAQSLMEKNAPKPTTSFSSNTQTAQAKLSATSSSSEEIKRNELLKEVVIETETIYKSLQKLTPHGATTLSFKSLNFSNSQQYITVTIQQLCDAIKNNKIQLLSIPTISWPQKRMLFVECCPFIDLDVMGTINLSQLHSSTEYRNVENYTEQLVFLRLLQFVRRYNQSYKHIFFSIPLLKGCFDKAFLEEINDMLTKTRFPSSHVILSLPFAQAVYLNEDGVIWSRLQRLRQRGVQLLIDVDFSHFDILSSNFSLIKESDFLGFDLQEIDRWLHEKDYAKRYEKFKGYMSFSPKMIFKQVNTRQELHKINLSPDGFQGNLAGPAKSINELVRML